MRLITPFEFNDMFPESRSLILVGNAPSLLGAGLGGWIDSFDVVVRFNECAMEGFETDVGKRTDILVSNPYPEARRRLLLDGQSARVLLIINPQTRRGDLEAFSRWAGSHSVLFTYTPSFAGLRGVDHDWPITTGTYTLQLLRRILLPSSLACTGFTMFLSDTAHHYWIRDTPAGAKKHDPVHEAELFVRILNAVNCKVEVTAEIAWVARMVGQRLRQNISIRPLPDPKWSAL